MFSIVLIGFYFSCLMINDDNFYADPPCVLRSSLFFWTIRSGHPIPQLPGLINSPDSCYTPLVLRSFQTFADREVFFIRLVCIDVFEVMISWDINHLYCHHQHSHDLQIKLTSQINVRTSIVKWGLGYSELPHSYFKGKHHKKPVSSPLQSLPYVCEIHAHWL